jgi:hypothetical protein
MKTKSCLLVFLLSQLHLWSGSAPSGDYIAHEWGTFTSVQGGDGIALEWNPLVITELPGFVYDHRTGGRGDAELVSKSAYPRLQRMETPVIYFYSEQERTVDVGVTFPQGAITEWYPQTTQLGTNDARRFAQGKSTALYWDGMQILPRGKQAETSPPLPGDKSGSHYYAARETDANVVRVSNGPQAKVEQERFLFYRGVGSFKAPLQVRLSQDEEYLDLVNTGSEELTPLFVLNIRKAGGVGSIEGKFLHVHGLKVGESKTVELHPRENYMSLADLRPRIMERMQGALVRQGLYEREAAAMVKTWEDSWFGEEGLRVLYLLPRAWTDRILPLQLKPAPRELARVMVGRSEMITPTMEWQLLKQVVKFSESDDTTRPNVVADTRQLGLGRFAEPTMRRILGKAAHREFSQAAWKLIEAAAKPPTSSKGLAAK